MKTVTHLVESTMATAATDAGENLSRLQHIIGKRKEEVKKQFSMLRANLASKERALCAQLDEIYTATVNVTKGLTHSIEQLDLSMASLKNTLKENHMLNLLERTVGDLDVEKQKLVDESETTRNVHLLWKLEPFVNDLKELCTISTTTADESFVNKNIQLIRTHLESFGFVIMTDASKLVSICRINTGSPAERSQLKVGDILLQLNGEDLANATHFDVVEKIRGLTRLTLSIKRTSV